MKLDILTGGQEINFDLSSRYFICLVHISLLLSLLAMVSSHFKIMK